MLRFPALLASLASGALLLALAIASYPLFISATASAALEKQIAYTTRFGSGVGVVSGASPVQVGDRLALTETFAERDELVRATLRGPHLAPLVVTVLGPLVDAHPAGHPNRTIKVRLVSRTGALEHVDIAEGEPADGAVMADLTARNIRAEPGDQLVLTNQGAAAKTQIKVDATYKALFNQPRTPYWLPLNRQIYPPAEDPFAPPPPTLLIVDRPRALELSQDLSPAEGRAFGFPSEELRLTWERPLRLRDPLTIQDAREVLAFANRYEKEFRTDRRFARTFCFRCFRGTAVTSNMREVVLQTERRLAAVEGPVRLVLVAGLLVALAVIAGAGAFAVVARRTETGLLFTRGMNPATVAAKTFLESIIPVVIGAAAGLGLAWLLVAVAGPQGAVDPSATQAALVSAAIAVPVSIVLLALVAAVSFARYSDAGSGRFSLLARIPWEIALLLAAGYFYNRLRSGGALVVDAATDVDRPSVALLLFPILLIGGLAMLGARGFLSVVGRVREPVGRISSAMYVVINRLAGASRVVLLLVAGTGLALGIFVHAQTLVHSLEKTVDAKAHLFVGSDVQGIVGHEYVVPELPFPATKSTRLLFAGEVGPVGRSVDLVGIDPATIDEATYWDADFGADSVAEVAGALADDGGDTLRVAVANAELPRIDSFTYEESAEATTVPIEVVMTLRTFPGTSSRQPLLVADAAAVNRLFEPSGPLKDLQASSELWAKGDARRISAQLLALDSPPASLITAEEVMDIPSISAAIDTFGVLNVLGLGAGLLVIVVMLMYLQARQRARVVSFALSRRMGLSTSSHRRALVVELAILLVGSFLLGGLLAIAAALIVVGLIDPLAAIPPDPLFKVPLLRLLIAAVVLVAIAIIGGAITNYRAGRARIAELMRVAD